MTGSSGEILELAARELRRCGRLALCHIVRVEGSTPGKPGWRLLVRPDGSTEGNLGGGAFEALVTTDVRQRLAECSPESELKRYYFTEKAVRGEPTGMVCGGMAEVFLEVLVTPPVLAVMGGGPVGQAIARVATECQLDVVVADDRAEFREPQLFPADATVVEVEPTGVLAPASRTLPAVLPPTGVRRLR